MIAVVLGESPASAHDFERTQVTLTFARDGSFVLDVTNDAAWLQHRLVPFAGSFADRVVLFVDAREVRPDSLEYIPPSGASAADQPRLGTYRMRGTMPADARVLRWYYGLPIDPYPLTVRRADGRLVVQEIDGDAWSAPIDLSGQFRAPLIDSTAVAVVIALLLLIPATMRFARRR